MLCQYLKVVVFKKKEKNYIERENDYLRKTFIGLHYTSFTAIRTSCIFKLLNNFHKKNGSKNTVEIIIFCRQPQLQFRL
jgi:hypothetical protein